MSVYVSTTTSKLQRSELIFPQSPTGPHDSQKLSGFRLTPLSSRRDGDEVKRYQVTEEFQSV